MERIWTTELADNVGREVRLAGWLHRLRQLGAITFLILRDGKGLAQIVVKDTATIELLQGLYSESVLALTGRVVATPQAPGGVEIHDPMVTVLSASEEPPPFDLFRPTIAAALPTILDHAAISLRHPRHRALFKVSAVSASAFRGSLGEMGFVEINTPKIVAAATETGANLFEVDYMGRPAFLAQSPQLYKQIMVGIFERVFEIGPVFRAEPHDTPRHINQYFSLDLEIGFIESHRDVMRVLNSVVAAMVGGVRESAVAEVELLGIELPDVPAEIPIVHFGDAQEMIAAATGENLEAELDLAPSHEVWLCDWSLREHGTEFLFVEGFPVEKRPFYTHADPDRDRSSRGFDLLFRGWEIVTGGQRLNRYGDYIAALQKRGDDPAPYAGYLEAFRHGMPPHGGFAMGLERWTARLAGITNLRETTLFPRDLNRLTP